MPRTAPPPLYSRAVLGLNGGPTDDLVVRFGCEMARGRPMELIALHVIEVDWRHDLSEDLASRDGTAATVLDGAEGIAEAAGVTLRTELLQARDVGAALVDEATELDADLVILGLPYRQRFGGDFAIGDVIPYVFQNASSTVLVVRESVSESGGRRAERSAITFGRAS